MAYAGRPSVHHPQHHVAYPAVMQPQPLAARPGIFENGTKVQVGRHRVVVAKYLSEGGFAHVYAVEILPRPGQKAVLKRVVVPDKTTLRGMQVEVDTMKKLKGHRHIVTYIDSHASKFGQGYEVFLLMELCSEGGLIDYMNTRLQIRLTEPEILQIFAHVAEGVAAMHYLKPPLLHRDLKVENVLITASRTTPPQRVYKVCDFGSAAEPKPAATTAAGFRELEDDIQRHTTIQYRSPEMMDVYRKQPIDEKSDIWALGVLLYKLCYYTTPFEPDIKLAVLNASYKVPAYPPFSSRLKRLIAVMLKENPRQRPNIYAVVAEVCSMRGTQIPIDDIYNSSVDVKSMQYGKSQLSHPQPTAVVGLSKVTEAQQSTSAASLPDITPMRRGRPKQPQPSVGSSHIAAPNAQPVPGLPKDPFAALDSTTSRLHDATSNLLPTKYPTVEEFSELHDPKNLANSKAESLQRKLQQKVSESLVNDVPNVMSSPSAPSASQFPTASTSVPQSELSRRKQSHTQLTPPTDPKYISPSSPAFLLSTSRISPLPSPSPASFSLTRPAWKVPTKSYEDSTYVRTEEVSDSVSEEAPVQPEHSHKRNFLERLSHHAPHLPKSLSTKHSTEGARPSLDTTESPKKSRSLSTHRSLTTSKQGDVIVEEIDVPVFRRRPSSSHTLLQGTTEQVIENDIDFLRALESPEDASSKGKNLRRSVSSHKPKKSSISLSLSSTKSLLTSKFGDAFRRFDNHDRHRPSDTDLLQAPLSPITASTDQVDTDDDDMQRQETIFNDKMGANTTTRPVALESLGTASNILNEEEEKLSPGARRELEQLRLAEVEERVAAKLAEHRNRGATATKSNHQSQPTTATTTQASLIQSRARNLLEATKSGSAKPIRTAEGYGRYTQAAPTPTTSSPSLTTATASSTTTALAPAAAAAAAAAAPSSLATRLCKAGGSSAAPTEMGKGAASGGSSRPAAQAAVMPTKTGPVVAPKPVGLRTGTPPVLTGAGSNRATTAAAAAAAEVGTQKPGYELGNNGIPHILGHAIVHGTQHDGHDDLEDFAKRFPSLDDLEMVEHEITASDPHGS